MSVALKVAETSETIFVGDDTDLMTLLCRHASTDHKRIHYHREAKTKDKNRGISTFKTCCLPMPYLNVTQPRGCLVLQLKPLL